MPPIGVFGGTFDPIHFGHLRLAEEMADTLGLERVLFIPAGQPPHRDAPRTPAKHRLAMVRRALTGNPCFEVDDREVSNPAPSYTVDTLTALRAARGSAQPIWLMLGADAFMGLASWHEWRALFDLANIVVATRQGTPELDIKALPEPLRGAAAPRLVRDVSTDPAGRILLRRMTPLDISATAIRATLSERRSVRYLLPDAVLDYIHEHRLYLHHEH
jgi:nicotinate-nucleotide adenylyltransferase